MIPVIFCGAVSPSRHSLSHSIDNVAEPSENFETTLEDAKTLKMLRLNRAKWQ